MYINDHIRVHTQNRSTHVKHIKAAHRTYLSVAAQLHQNFACTLPKSTYVIWLFVTFYAHSLQNRADNTHPYYSTNSSFLLYSYESHSYRWIHGASFCVYVHKKHTTTTKKSHPSQMRVLSSSGVCCLTIFSCTPSSLHCVRVRRPFC